MRLGVLLRSRAGSGAWPRRRALSCGQDVDAGPAGSPEGRIGVAGGRGRSASARGFAIRGAGTRSIVNERGVNAMLSNFNRREFLGRTSALLSGAYLAGTSL